MQREVVVVGAGPAGATAAAMLAQKGCDVLLIDRQPFPRDKTCGDAIPVGVIEMMLQMGMEEKLAAAQAKGQMYPVHFMRLVSPGGYVLDAQFQGGKTGVDSYVSPRLYFDALLYQHAVDCGAEFMVAQVKAPLMENGRVVGIQAAVNGTPQEIQAQVVIGADGVTSAIARSLRAKSERHRDSHRAVAMRAYLENVEEIPHTVEFYLHKKILPGYIWVFPTGENRVNIGAGIRLDYFRKTRQQRGLPEMLQEFLEMPAMKNRLKGGWTMTDQATWQLNFGSQKRLRYVYDGALLVGDAAGLINPLTGGGIHNALISAELAAKAVMQALQKQDTSRETLQIYERWCHQALDSSMKRSYQFLQLLTWFPTILDPFIRWGRGNSQLVQTFLTKL